MPKNFLETQAIILNKEKFEENFLRLNLFSPTNGQVLCLARLSKTQKSPLPDLFDLISIQLSPAKQGSLFFLNNFQLIHRHSNISKNYHAFYYACQWAQVLSLNLSHIDRPQPLFSLTQTALNAFENSPNPHSTYLKALFLFTRQEGYPIKEDWLKKLSPDSLTNTLTILHSPLENQTISQNNTEKLIDHLHSWIQKYTDILLPTPTIARNPSVNPFSSPRKNPTPPIPPIQPPPPLTINKHP